MGQEQQQVVGFQAPSQEVMYPTLQQPLHFQQGTPRPFCELQQPLHFQQVTPRPFYELQQPLHLCIPKILLNRQTLIQQAQLPEVGVHFRRALRPK